MKLLLFSALSVVLMHTSHCLNCYQCSGSDSSKPFQCNEWLSSDIDIQPEPCDNVYDAKYCIKHTGRFEASAIKCYQCSSATSLECSDGMIQSGGIEPESCDYMFEAEYCVKSTSLDGPAYWALRCKTSLKCMRSDNPVSVPTRPDFRACTLLGGIGAKRFCSSLDLGNYCNYVQQPGDTLEYRTCVFTCSGDGCNPATVLKPTSLMLLPILLLAMFRAR